MSELEARFVIALVLVAGLGIGLVFVALLCGLDRPRCEFCRQRMLAGPHGPWCRCCEFPRQTACPHLSLDHPNRHTIVMPMGSRWRI